MGELTNNYICLFALLGDNFAGIEVTDDHVDRRIS